MSGTDKRQLLVIRKSKQPRCFCGKSLPMTYTNNSNVWMTSEIFFHQIDTEMWRKKCKIILFVDNCSAHPSTAADKCNNIKFVFLPPNSTSVIQPCDQGIIKNFKTHCRSMVINSIIDDIDNQVMTATDLARKLTLLNAVHMATRAWTNVKPTTIVNCFRKGRFHLSTPDPATPAEPKDDDIVPVPTSVKLQKTLTHS